MSIPMVSLKFDYSDFDANSDRLKEVIQGAIRPAAQAAAKVYYDEMKIRAAQSEKGTGKGLLARSIYQKYVKEDSTTGWNAVYHISWNKGRGGQTPAAPHGVLLEYGWVQRYANYMDTTGRWWTAVRPEMKGKPKPKSRSPQEEMDAYYVVRKKGSIQHAPRPFLRPTYEAKEQEALAAAQKEMQERLLKAFL